MKRTGANLKGNWGTLLLPILKDESIDWSILSEEMDAMIDAKVSGIYSNGTACEFHNQTEAEFDRIQVMLAEKCQAAGMPFQIGASHPAPAISLGRIKRSVPLRPDGFQIILPDWVVCNDEEQLTFLKGCADAAEGIPLVLYNPPHAKQVCTPQRLSELAAAVPSLIGVKVAGGDAHWYDAMRWSAGNFSVFVPGHFLASGFSTGVACGAYSNVACLSPKGAQWWWNLMHTDLDQALDIERRILQFFDECVVPFKVAGFSNPALDKLLAAAGGWCPIGTRLRWPYKWIDAQQVPHIAERARHWLPELMSFNDH